MPLGRATVFIQPVAALADTIRRHGCQTPQFPSEYSEGSIRVLKGLEPVKQRPGMYTRTDNPLHIIQEVLDNAADEGPGRLRQKIKVTLHADGSVSVEDDGRGIPFGLHPGRKGAGDRAGSPACTRAASSTRARAGLQLLGRPARRGRERDQRPGHAAWRPPATAKGRWRAWCSRAATWSSRWWSCARWRPASASRAPPCASGPMPWYFESSSLPMGELTHLLRSKAVLMPGVSVTLVNEKTATPRPGNTRAACATT